MVHIDADVPHGEVSHAHDRHKQSGLIRQWLHKLQIGRSIVKKPSELPVLLRVFTLISGKTSKDALVVLCVEACVETCVFISEVKNSVPIFWIGHIIEIVEVDYLFPENVIDIFLQDRSIRVPRWYFWICKTP